MTTILARTEVGDSDLRRNILLMFGFGLLSLLAGMVQFQIPGVEGGVSDLRETALLIAMLHLGHWWYGLGVAFITSLATPAQGSFLSTLAMHALGAVAAWHFFRIARQRIRGEVAYGLATSAFVVVYYVVLLLPVMIATNILAGLVRPEAAYETYLTILGILPFELATTIGITALYAVADKLHSERQRVIEEAYDATLEGWARALEMRDRETEGHSRRVCDLTTRLGRAFGLSADELLHVRRGAILHDIGKMGIPDQILLKPGKPTEDEWAVLRRHPEYARRLLEPIEFLQPAMDIPFCHHERWDGSGYPNGLAGEEIPLAARIFAVVDVWDALRSERPYRPPWSQTRVVDHLRSHAGKHFDPKVVEVFLDQVVTGSDTGPESTSTRVAPSPRLRPG